MNFEAFFLSLFVAVWLLTRWARSEQGERVIDDVVDLWQWLWLPPVEEVE